MSHSSPGFAARSGPPPPRLHEPGAQMVRMGLGSSLAFQRAPGSSFSAPGRRKRYNACFLQEGVAAPAPVSIFAGKQRGLQSEGGRGTFIVRVISSSAAIRRAPRRLTGTAQSVGREPGQPYLHPVAGRSALVVHCECLGFSERERLFFCCTGLPSSGGGVGVIIAAQRRACRGRGKMVALCYVFQHRNEVGVMGGGAAPPSAPRIGACPSPLSFLLHRAKEDLCAER
eukprot:gene13904-biopygen3556